MEKGRNWIATYNNYQTHGVESPEEFLEGLHSKGGAKFVVGQLERGAEGTPHIQFCTGFVEPKRLAAMKKYGIAIHWEVCRDVQQSIQYCQKQESRLEGPWIYGELPVDKQAAGKKGGEAKAEKYRAALELAKNGKVYDIDAEILIPHLRNLKAIATDHLKGFESDDTRGIWVCGEPGHGKSYWARSLATDPSDLYFKPQSKWWDGYAG